MRTWDSSNPKAALMTRKRDLIVAAALKEFLDDGYEGSSVNRIADEAGVSIKTLYRHFENKEDLFIAVIKAACARASDPREPEWMEMAPLTGLTVAATEHLPFILSVEQLALYRVVTQAPDRFPQLGLSYRDQVVGERVGRLRMFFDRWPDALRSRIADPSDAAHTFIALTEGDFVEAALLGAAPPEPAAIRAHSELAARRLLALVEADLV